MADSACCTANGDTPNGPGSVCLGDGNANGVDDACEVTPIIPTVSEWGLIIMVMLGLAVGTIVFARRRTAKDLA